ncbi:MAG: tetratricopeptide repeat protein, partial [Spirochaetales bacterium]|nr:tetratricopeptide repeat protein [Spirochaetales bacterium]
MKVAGLFFVAFAVLSASVSAQEANLPALLHQARAALDQENYQTAVQTFLAARKQFPNSAAPARELGDLYEGQKLYKLALEQYSAAVRLDPGDPKLRLSEAESLSYLDQNARAITVLETALKDFPQNKNTAQALGWLYFKTGQNLKGTALIENILKTTGPDQNLEMTLGILYSGLYEYQNSRRHYLKAIDLAQGNSPPERHFRSICWYNLSLLEKNFNRNDLAFQDLQKSLDAENRAVTWLALGELFQAQLDVPKAYNAFQTSAKTDETPLSFYDLALLDIQEGQLDQAMAEARNAQDFHDDSWIYDFGVTKTQFSRDMALLWRDLWKAKARALNLQPRPHWWDYFSWFTKKVLWSIQAWYWDQRYKVFQVDLAQSAQKAGNTPESWSDYALANRDHPEVSLKYLAKLRAFEVPLNPSALPSYLSEEGRIRHDPGLLERAIALFKTPDQKAEMVETEMLLAENLRARGAPVSQWYPWLNRVWANQPGALYIHG